MTTLQASSDNGSSKNIKGEERGGGGGEKERKEISGWLLAPQKGEFVKRYTTVDRTGIYFYNDEEKINQIGILSYKNILDITKVQLEHSGIDVLQQNPYLLGIWKSDRTVYYLAFIKEDLRDIWEDVIRNGLLEYTNNSDKPSTQLQVPTTTSPNQISKDDNKRVKSKIPFPIPGVILHQFTHRIYRDCIKFFYIRRINDDPRFNNLSNRFSNMFISPIGLYALLSMLWCGAGDDSVTHEQLKEYLAKMPHYHNFDMGSWKVNRQIQAKQLMLWLIRLGAHNPNEREQHTKNQEEKENKTEEPEGVEHDDDVEIKEKEDKEKEDKETEEESPYKVDSKITSILISNCLFINSEYQLATNFRKLFKKMVRHARFYDESRHSDITAAINKWEAKHALTKTPKVGSQLQLIEANIIGVSTLYFHGIFWYSFNPQNSKKLPFFTDMNRSEELKKVIFINGKTKCRYYDGTQHNDCFTIVALDYHLTNTELLPRLSLVLVKRISHKKKKRGEDINHIGSKAISLSDFYAAMKKSKRQVVDLSFPKINLDTLIDISHVLEEPLENAFDVTEANFVRICKNAQQAGCCVSQLLHSVRVTIDEKGEQELPKDLMDGSAPKEEFNYPFDIYIINPHQDQIFLCGRITNPDLSAPFAESLLRQENENTQHDEDIQNVRTSRWKCW